MKTNVTALTIILLIVYSGLFAQVPVGDNCSAPKPVSVSCPNPTVLPNETTTGFTNDVNSRYYIGNTTGNDVVYQVTVPAGTQYLVVSVTSASKPFYIISNNNNCSYAYSSSYWYVSGVTNNLMIPVYGYTTCYLWIDHNNSTDITYGLAFGLITSSTVGNYSNSTTQPGNWNFDNVCTSPQTKNGINVTWNGVSQSLPLSYTPLNTPGVVCGETFLRNTTGMEGAKYFQFTFGSDLINVSPTATTLPGFYNKGTWKVSQSGNKFTWSFSDSAGLGYGDFTGNPKNCLTYTFCFNMTPTSHDYTGTSIRDSIFPDGRGFSSGYYTYQGCCATPGSCIGNGGGIGTGGGGIGTGFGDPGTLPVKLVNFNGVYKSGKNELQWQTASESNSNYFQVERSEDSEDFYTIGTVNAAGNSSDMKFYSYSDAVVSSEEVLYYRLKQVDKDGTFTYSEVIAIQQHTDGTIRLYPNPAHNTLLVEGAEHVQRIVLTDATGTATTLEQKTGNGYNVSSLKPGIYFVLVYCDNEVVTDKLLIE